MPMEELRAIHARRLWLDATSIIGLIAAVIAMTWFVSVERNEIKAALYELKKDIAAITLKQVELGQKMSDRWTRQDMATFSELWCSKAEILNKTWRCPDVTPNRVGNGGD